MNLQMAVPFRDQLKLLLAAVDTVDTGPGAIVVAGGSLRDHLHGRQIKDIDVFIRTDLKPAVVLERMQAGPFPDAQLQYDMTYWDDPEVWGVVDLGVHVFGVPATAILLKIGETPAKIVERIDFGLCQIGMDKDGYVLVTEAYLKDAMNKTMTLVRCLGQGDYKRSMSRYERLAAKYPNHTLVIPDEFKPVAPLDWS
jgi:hypothetical protein